MITRETIYKRTSTGAIQIWYGQLEGNAYRTVSGQQHGKLTTSQWTYCSGKNQGRSNETTPEAQAAFELDAMYKKKLEREYRRDITMVDVKHYTKPMKAIKWYEDAKKRPAAGTLIGIEPKLDGMRCLGSANGCKSQDGKIIPGAPHIDEALQCVYEVYPDIEFDGELYNHEYKEDFEELMSALKTEIDTDAEREHARRVVQYHIYDIASHPGDEIDRRETLESIFDEFLKRNDNQGYFHLVERKILEMDEDGTVVEEINDHNIEELGYEGSMVRVLKGKYVNKRSNHLFKVKKFEDDEFPVEEVLEGKGNWAGHAKAFKVRLPNGNVCKATLKGNKAKLKEVWENRADCKNWMATVKYLRYSKKGMLNLPVVKVIDRWDLS